MEYFEAIRERHAVRKYQDRPIEAKKVQQIPQLIDERSQQGQPLPDWFRQGMEAAMLAPTAMNQQKFEFTILDNNEVRVKAKFDLFGNAAYDLGIVKCNFEIGAGKENFEWQ